MKMKSKVMITGDTLAAWLYLTQAVGVSSKNRRNMTVCIENTRWHIISVNQPGRVRDMELYGYAVHPSAIGHLDKATIVAACETAIEKTKGNDNADDT